MEQKGTIMTSSADFIKILSEKYSPKGESILLGAGMLDGETFADVQVQIPLKMFNRHGLISGATGTGKTKTIQALAGQLSEKGVPVLMMDIKGDLSGISQPGTPHPKIDERHEKIGLPFKPQKYPVEFLSLSDEHGVKLRATVSEFGPILFAKMLELNDTQTGVLAILFKYCDDNKLPLLDLKDVKKTFQYMMEEGKDEVEKNYGRLSTSTIGIILRKIVELEQQGADRFFGEISFDVTDLIRMNDEGMGYISLLRLTDIQDKPKLFSTFMLAMLAEIYSVLPEAGDLDRPKLVIIIDEAHLIFDEASNALLDQLEAIIKLIRSKGIGVFFCTQSPKDIPEEILGQLGLKVQHALRAFTAKDRKAIKLAAENYPTSEFYDTAKVMTELGIGEALVTALSERGTPTPLVATLLCAPKSRMDVITDKEMKEIINGSKLIQKYNQEIDSDSAYEILERKIEEFEKAENQEQRKIDQSKADTAVSNKRADKSTLEMILGSSTGRQIGRTIAREFTRGLLGVLGLGGR